MDQNNEPRPRSDSTDISYRKIFIGGLSYTTDEEKLKKYFKQYGSVQDAVVMKDPVSRRSRGFGFITFYEMSSVDNALAHEPHTIDSRKVEAKRAVPRSEMGRENVRTTSTGSASNSTLANTPLNSSANHSVNASNPSTATSSPQLSSQRPSINYGSTPGGYDSRQATDPKINMEEYAYNKIFVGGLHYDTRDPEFRAYFEKYGKIIGAEVMFNRETHKSRGFGFVVYETEESAIKVCNEKEHIINGKLVEVKRAIPRSRIHTPSATPPMKPLDPPPMPNGSPASSSNIRANVRRTMSTGSAQQIFGSPGLSGNSSTLSASTGAQKGGFTLVGANGSGNHAVARKSYTAVMGGGSSTTMNTTTSSSNSSNHLLSQGATTSGSQSSPTIRTSSYAAALLNNISLSDQKLEFGESLLFSDYGRPSRALSEPVGLATDTLTGTSLLGGTYDLTTGGPLSSLLQPPTAAAAAAPPSISHPSNHSSRSSSLILGSSSQPPTSTASVHNSLTGGSGNSSLSAVFGTLGFEVGGHNASWFENSTTGTTVDSTLTSNSPPLGLKLPPPMIVTSAGTGGSTTTSISNDSSSNHITGSSLFSNFTAGSLLSYEINLANNNTATGQQPIVSSIFQTPSRSTSLDQPTTSITTTATDSVHDSGSHLKYPGSSIVPTPETWASMLAAPPFIPSTATAIAAENNYLAATAAGTPTSLLALNSHSSGSSNINTTTTHNTSSTLWGGSNSSNSISLFSESTTLSTMSKEDVDRFLGSSLVFSGNNNSNTSSNASNISSTIEPPLTSRLRAYSEAADIPLSELKLAASGAASLATVSLNAGGSNTSTSTSHPTTVSSL